MCFGTVQVPSGGQPIVLMADRQTTGGYPRIAEVVTADLPRLAQVAPGSVHLRFERVTLDVADAARSALGRRVNDLLERLRWEFHDAKSIDLNCDMGESFGAWKMGDDAAIMPLITSANVAAGFHAGDPATIRDHGAARRSITASRSARIPRCPISPASAGA